MEGQNNRIDKINLVEVCFAVCRKWKTIVVCALIAALLAGAAQTASALRKWNDSDALKEEEEQYQQQLLEYTHETEKLQLSLKNKKTEIANQEEYLQKSISMSLDPHGISEATATVYVDTGYQIIPGTVQNPDKTATVIALYAVILRSHDVLQAIAVAYGTEARYISEILTIKTEPDGLLTICVRHDSIQKANDILDRILGTMDEHKAKIESVVAQHSVYVVDRAVRCFVDLQLQTLQEQENDYLWELKQEKDTLEKNLAEHLRNEPRNNFQKSIPGLVKGVGKMALLAFAAAALLLAAVFAFGHLMSGVIYSEQTFRDNCSGRILAILAGKKNRGATSIDRLLDRIEHRHTADTENDYALLAENIRGFAPNGGMLLLTGSLELQRLKELADQLSPLLPGYRIICGDDMFTSAETAHLLQECGAVITVCALDRTAITAWRNMAEKVNDLGKDHLGTILLEQ